MVRRVIGQANTIKSNGIAAICIFKIQVMVILFLDKLVVLNLFSYKLVVLSDFQQVLGEHQYSMILIILVIMQTRLALLLFMEFVFVEMLLVLTLQLYFLYGVVLLDLLLKLGLKMALHHTKIQLVMVMDIIHSSQWTPMVVVGYSVGLMEIYPLLIQQAGF